MAEFVYNSGTLPDGKSDGHALVGPANENITSAEWNSVMQALDDVRTAILAFSPAPGQITGSVVGTTAQVILSSSAQTIPSITDVVIVKCLSGLQLASTPSVQTGSTVGQRLQITMDSGTSGSLGIQSISQIASSVYLVGSDSISLVVGSLNLCWNGTYWEELSRAENPGTIKNVWSGYQVYAGQSFVGGVQVYSDPASGSVLAVDINVSTLDLNITFEDIDMIGTPTLSDGGPTLYDWQEVLIINRGTSFKMTIHDNDDIAGTKLKLSTPTFDLVNGSNIRLRWVEGDGLWYEVARSDPTFTDVRTFTVTSNSDIIPTNASVVNLVAGSNADYTLTSTPAIQDGIVDGQIVTLYMQESGAGSIAGGFFAPDGTVTFNAATSARLIWDADVPAWFSLDRYSQPFLLGAQVFAKGTGVTGNDPSVLDVPNAGSDGTGALSTVDVQLTGNDTLTSTPSITTGVNVRDGTEITIICRNPTFQITLQDEGTLPGSGLRLSTTTVNLKKGSSIRLRYFAADGVWYEMARAILV